MRLSVCIEMVFTEYPFSERPRKAAEAGLRAIEIWGWRDRDLKAVKEARARYGLEISAMSGHEFGGVYDDEGGKAVLDDLVMAMEIAKDLDCRHLMVMADDESGRVNRLSPETRHKHAVKYLRQASRLAEETGMTLVLEPVNNIVDHPNNCLNSSRDGFALVKEVGSPALKLLYDIYHMQVMEGNLIETITKNIDLIGYIHAADVPGRHEPGTGEIDYPNVLHALGVAGYRGTVGLEFIPSESSEQAMAKVTKNWKGIFTY